MDSVVDPQHVSSRGRAGVFVFSGREWRPIIFRHSLSWRDGQIMWRWNIFAGQHCVVTVGGNVFCRPNGLGRVDRNKT